MSYRDELIEKAARAVADQCGIRRESELGAEMSIAIATEALDAILEGLSDPSEEMLAASAREWDGRMSYRSTGAFVALINTLKEGK